jgi:predicted MFS family arabinose efflux permease
MSLLVTGSVVGGFSGRLVTGLVAQALGWRSSFVALAALTVGAGAASARWLPHQSVRTSPRSEPLRALRALAARLDGRLVVTYVVGFNVFFTQAALLTYVTFHLAEPPYLLSVAQLSWMFVVYLVGAVVTPFAGRGIDRVGSRRMLATALAVALGGTCLTLVPSVAAIVSGIALCCTAAFTSQSAATSFLQIAAPREVRSTASGVYVSCYYFGGCVGGAVPAVAWHVAGWTGVVALVAIVQLVTLALALRFWKERARDG